MVNARIPESLFDLPDFGAIFKPHFETATANLRAYAATLSPALRKLIEDYGPFPRPGRIPRSLKPHSIWIAQFFGVTDPEVIAQAFTASLLMELHCCLQDRRIDGELRYGMDYATSDALSNVLLSDSLVRFAEIAGHPEFHSAARKAFCDLGEAYAAEAAGALPQLSPERMFKAVVDRAAPFHILVAAMGYHSRRIGQIAPCSTMVCHLILWFQILDDAADWEKDLGRRRRSYLLHRLEPWMEGKPFEQWRDTDVADALYLFGGAESLLDESIEQLRMADEIARANAAAPALADSPEALLRWLKIFIQVHTRARAWSIERKREFLRTAAPAAGGGSPLRTEPE